MMRAVRSATPSATTMQKLATGETWATASVATCAWQLKPSPRPILPMSCRMLNPLAVEKY